MKKYLIIAVLLLSATAYGFGGLMMGSGTIAGGASCDTVVQGETAASTYTVNFDQWSSDVYTGTRFQATETATICKIIVYLDAYGAGSSGLTTTASIWSDVFSDPTYDPNSQIGTASDGLDLDTLTGSEAAYTMDNVSADITNGTYYWVVLYTDGRTNNSSDYDRWHGNASGTVESIKADADGAGVWTNKSSFRTARYVLYK